MDCCKICVTFSTVSSPAGDPPLLLECELDDGGFSTSLCFNQALTSDFTSDEDFSGLSETGLTTAGAAGEETYLYETCNFYRGFLGTYASFLADKVKMQYVYFRNHVKLLSFTLEDPEELSDDQCSMLVNN